MSMEIRRYPVSMTELGIYLEWRKNLQGTAYNIPFLFPLPEGTDLNRLKDSLCQVFRAHCSLLSRFQMETDGSIYRLVPEGDREEIFVNILESRGEPDMRKLIRPFSDLDGELYRLNIILADEKKYLFMDIHHILFDGASIPVFMRDLNRAYAGDRLEEEVVTAGNFATQEQNARDTEAFMAARAWYEELLSDTEISSTPIHDKETGEARNVCFTIPLGIDEKQISSYTQSLGIRTSTFFTGIYGYLISRFLGAKEALYASIHSGRTPENAGTIGMFVQTFPVLERFNGKESIASHLKDLENQLRKSRASSLFSYTDICSVFYLTIPTLFAYQGDLFPEMDFLGGKTVPEAIQS